MHKIKVSTEHIGRLLSKMFSSFVKEMSNIDVV